MITFLKKYRWFAVILTLLLAAEIFYFSTLTGTIIGGDIPYLSYIYHFAAFFLFGFFLLFALKKDKLKSRDLILTGIFSLLYAISDEIHQIFVPLRSASVGDILIDSLGICVALLVGLSIKNSKK